MTMLLASMMISFSRRAMTAQKCNAFVTVATRKIPLRFTLSTLQPQQLSLHSHSNNDFDHEINNMRVGEIKKELESYGISTKAFFEKSELIQALTKARQEQRLGSKRSSQTTSPQQQQQQQSTSYSSSSQTNNDNSADRERRLQEEINLCRTLKVIQLKRELRERGVDITALFEKSELVQALAKARVDGVVGGPPPKQEKTDSEEGYAEYRNVEVLTDESSGPQKRGTNSQQQQPTQPSSSSSSSGSNPFAGFADLFGGGTGGMFSNPFPSASAPAPNSPSADAFNYAKAQELISNPQVMEILKKAQSNPRLMQIMTECVANPTNVLKYQNDPDLQELLQVLQKNVSK